MSLLKPKIFIPLCLAGIITGYTAAEYIIPKYFHPTVDTKFTQQDILNAIGAQPHYFRQTSSGNYLAGQFAQQHKDWNKAAEYINRVSRKEKENTSFQKHSMILSMAAGDTDQSIKLSKDVLKTDPNDLLATLFTSVGYFKSNNYQAAINVLSNIEKDNVASFIVPALNVWAKAGIKEFNIEGLPANSFYSYHTLLAGNYLNQKDKALSFALESFSTEGNDLRDLEKYGDAFLAFGAVDKALSIYQEIEKQNFASLEVKEKIDNLEKNKAFNEPITLPVITSPKKGAALVFQNMAEVLLREYSDDSATIFAQMSLALDNSLYHNHAFIAEVYNRYERYDDAIDILQKIDKKSELYSNVQRQIAELYTKKEENTEAIQILEKLHEEDNDLNALIQIGDIYRYEEDYENAEQIYTRVLKDTKVTAKDYWHVYYARGMALERLKKFEAAEKDLQKALEVEPNNPYLLNYLGYSWVDRGMHFEESLKMITKAVTLKPNDGYITDSLGWAHYKMTNYKEAIPPLERAVELLPYDATINDHLGDAYWQVGRKNEARFQWQRALNHNEDNDLELKEAIQKKLISGLTNKEISNTNTVNQTKTTETDL